MAPNLRGFFSSTTEVASLLDALPARLPATRHATPPHPFLFPPVPGSPLSVEVVLHEFRREMHDVLLQPISSNGRATGGKGAQLWDDRL
jgi:hypothetical protein